VKRVLIKLITPGIAKGRALWDVACLQYKKEWYIVSALESSDSISGRHPSISDIENITHGRTEIS
jgi:hypothetical protein